MISHDCSNKRLIDIELGFVVGRLPDDLIVFFLFNDTGTRWHEVLLRFLSNRPRSLSLRPQHQIAIEHIILETPCECHRRQRKNKDWIFFNYCLDRQSRECQTNKDRIVFDPLLSDGLLHCELGLPLFHSHFDLHSALVDHHLGLHFLHMASNAHFCQSNLKL